MNRLAPSVLTLVAFASTARAQPAAIAEQLFRDGKQAMTAKRYAEACTAFEGSERRDPNISTLMNLADCREKNEQLATAWSLFLQAASETQGDATLTDFHEMAQKRAALLEPRLSHLIINVPDESRVRNLAITRNGDPVDPAEWNRALPVDGGNFDVEGKAPDHEPWSTKVKIRSEGDKQSVDVPRFNQVSVAPKAEPANPQEADDADERPEPSRGLGRRRMAAIGFGGGAVAALGIGLAFEFSARSSYKSSLTENDRDRKATLIDEGNHKRYFAEGLAIVGAGAAVTATILWVTGANKPTRRTTIAPLVGTSDFGLALTGGF
jgi:hypothetical protein